MLVDLGWPRMGRAGLDGGMLFLIMGISRLCTRYVAHPASYSLLPCFFSSLLTAWQIIIYLLVVPLHLPLAPYQPTNGNIPGLLLNQVAMLWMWSVDVMVRWLTVVDGS